MENAYRKIRRKRYSLNGFIVMFARIIMDCNVLGSALYGTKYNSYRKTRILRNFQDYHNENELLKIIKHSKINVPYYKENLKNISSVKELQESGFFIDKEIIMSNFNDFLNSSLDKSEFIKGTTGGTSGKPLQLVIPRNRWIFELATMHTLWKTTGWDYDIRAVIRNHGLPKNMIFKVNPITREIIFDGFRLNDDYFYKIYKIICKNKIAFIHAYPSAAYQFSVFIKNNNLDTSFIKAFLSGSENVYDYQTDLIENKLGIRFYNWYGHSEKLLLGGYCNQTRNYHMEPSYGFFELIDENGRNITEPGRTGQIVGTTLHNTGMPLIRYKTGDYAEYAGDYCPHCKRHLPVIKNVVGRWNGEKIYNSDGTFITTTALNLHSELYSVLEGLQYIQDKAGQLKILIIPSNDYTKEHEKKIADHFKGKFNSDMKVEISYVKEIIKQPNGKFLQLISNVKDPGNNESTYSKA